MFHSSLIFNCSHRRSLCLEYTSYCLRFACLLLVVFSALYWLSWALTYCGFHLDDKSIQLSVFFLVYSLTSLYVLWIIPINSCQYDCVVDISGDSGKFGDIPIDFDDRLYIHPSDNSVTTITTIKLTGNENFRLWRSSMYSDLKARNKLGFFFMELLKRTP